MTGAEALALFAYLVVESSAHPCEKQLIAACLVYIWMITQGWRVIAEGNSPLIDRTDRLDKSVFRLGLDWSKYALKHRLEFQPFFHFQPLETIIHARESINS